MNKKIILSMLLGAVIIGAIVVMKGFGCSTCDEKATSMEVVNSHSVEETKPAAVEPQTEDHKHGDHKHGDHKHGEEHKLKHDKKPCNKNKIKHINKKIKK